MKAEPWVTLDPHSTVSITGTRLPLANDLSLLPLPFFDPSEYGRGVAGGLWRATR